MVPMGAPSYAGAPYPMYAAAGGMPTMMAYAPSMAPHPAYYMAAGGGGTGAAGGGLASPPGAGPAGPTYVIASMPPGAPYRTGPMPGGPFLMAPGGGMPTSPAFYAMASPHGGASAPGMPMAYMAYAPAGVPSSGAMPMYAYPPQPPA